MRSSVEVDTLEIMGEYTAAGQVSLQRVRDQEGD